MTRNRTRNSALALGVAALMALATLPAARAESAESAPAPSVAAPALKPGPAAAAPSLSEPAPTPGWAEAGPMVKQVFSAPRTANTRIATPPIGIGAALMEPTLSGPRRPEWLIWVRSPPIRFIASRTMVRARFACQTVSKAGKHPRR